MTYLLDVSVLIPLLDADHVFHDQAHQWFDRVGRLGWATCPITENGVIRIMGHVRYPGGFGNPGAVLAVVRELRTIDGHEFWADDVSLLTSPVIDLEGLATSARVTDSYLLALALSHGGRLATLDRRLSPAGVRGGAAALHLLPAVS